MPIAAASTGTRNVEPRDFSHSSSAIVARADRRAPMPIIVHGSSPPNMPFATDAISVACGAASECGCSAVGGPMPYAAASRFSTGAMISAHENEPIISISCCFHGVAPTI